MYSFKSVNGKLYGNVGVMCSRCHHIDICEIEENDENTIHTCSKCGTEIEIKQFINTIDPNISQYIERLNNIGLHTSYCCEGHNGYNAYIYFKEFDIEKCIDAFSILQVSNALYESFWYIDGDDLLFSKAFIIRAFPRTTLSERMDGLDSVIRRIEKYYKNEDKRTIV